LYNQSLNYLFYFYRNNEAPISDDSAAKSNILVVDVSPEAADKTVQLAVEEEKIELTPQILDALVQERLEELVDEKLPDIVDEKLSKFIGERIDELNDETGNEDLLRRDDTADFDETQHEPSDNSQDAQVVQKTTDESENIKSSSEAEAAQQNPSAQSNPIVIEPVVSECPPISAPHTPVDYNKVAEKAEKENDKKLQRNDSSKPISATVLLQSPDGQLRPVLKTTSSDSNKAAPSKPDRDNLTVSDAKKSLKQDVPKQSVSSSKPHVDSPRQPVSSRVAISSKPVVQSAAPLKNLGQ
jgi:hypothetical protein